MSALGDALEEKGRDFLVACMVLVKVDSAPTAVAATYAIRLEAPGYSATLLEGQTVGEVAAAVTELTDYVTARW